MVNGASVLHTLLIVSITDDGFACSQMVKLMDNMFGPTNAFVAGACTTAAIGAMLSNVILYTFGCDIAALPFTRQR